MILIYKYFSLITQSNCSDVAWAQREAYLELDRRQRLGLPLVDPNYVPPEKMQLLSDEELKDFEIII